jgi:hypothetical protein
MEQKVPQRFDSGQRYSPDSTEVRIILPAEGDPTLVQSQQAIVGNGHTMRIAGQIFQRLFRPAERRLA